MVRVPLRSEKDLTKVIDAIFQIAQGRLNCVGTFTLAAAATSTTVKAPTVSPGTVVLFSPATANAAAALSTTYVKLADVANGQFILTHISTGTTDRTFGYAAFGPAG